MPRKPSFSVQHRVLSFSLQHLAQSHHTTPRSQRPPDSCLTAPCTRPSFMPLLLLSSSPISSVLLAHVLYIDVIKRIPFSQKIPSSHFCQSDQSFSVWYYLSRLLDLSDLLPGAGCTFSLPDLSVALPHVCCQPDKSRWFRKAVFVLFKASNS